MIMPRPDADPFTIRENLEFIVTCVKGKGELFFQLVGPELGQLKFIWPANEPYSMLLFDELDRPAGLGLHERMETEQPGSKLLVRLHAPGPLPAVPHGVGHDRNLDVQYNNVLFPCQFAQIVFEPDNDQGEAVARLTFIAAAPPQS
jgi:hypothetical protein